MILHLKGEPPETHLTVATVVPVPDAVWICPGSEIVDKGATCIPADQMEKFMAVLALATEEAGRAGPIEFPVPRMSFGVRDVHEIGISLRSDVLEGFNTPRLIGLFEDVDKFLTEHVGADWADQNPE